MEIKVKQLSSIFENVNSGKKPVFDCKIECLEKWQVIMYSDIVRNIDYLSGWRVDGLTVYFSSDNGRIPESIFAVTQII